jgi:aldehyde:ferredoxin oxidoreductase
MGAVMGSKNLKAIAVKGNGSVKYADPLGLMELVSKMKTKIYENEEYDKRYQMGTTMLMKNLNSIGILPTNHFQQGVYDSVDDVSGEKLAEVYKVKNKACFNCNVHCSRYYITDKVEAEGPEYETLCSFSSKIGSNDLEFALEMNHYLNQNGLDSISAGEAISWLIECQERGIIKPEEVGGYKIKWGEKDRIRELLEMIINRNGIGDKLADGATKFSKSFSKEAQDLVMQVKGLDIICGDPRGIKAYGLTYAIASRGGDHLRAEPYFELTQKYKVAKQRFGTEKAADRLAEDGKAALVTWSEKIALLTDCLTMCKNIGLCMDVLDFEEGAKLLSLATGVDYTASYLEKILGKAIEMDYKLNQKFGLSTDQDTLPDRFTKEPLTSGESKGSVVDIEKMVKEYRKLHDRE